MSDELVKVSEEAGGPESAPDLKQWASQVSVHLGRARHQLAELASQQNALIIKAIDEGIDLVRTAPTPDLRQLASEGLAALEEARQSIATLAQLPPEQLAEVARSQAGQAVDGAADLAGAGAAALLQAGTRLLDQVGRKNEEIADSVREEFQLDESSAAAALVDFSRQVVNNYVEVQKRWFELGLRIPFIRSHVDGEKESAPAESAPPVNLPGGPQ